MISIAMATYNGEKYLHEQLDSILAQTYIDFELIICDDCSRDRTMEILREYERKDNRIKIYKNDKNLGFKKNFQQLINYCNGNYISFSDQDDIWLPNKLELLVNNIGEFSLICSDSELIDSDGNSLNLYMKRDVLGIKYFPRNQLDMFISLLQRNFVQGATILAKKDFITKYCVIPDAFEFHDYWFAICASVDGGLRYLDNVTLLYRQHTSQQTLNKKVHSRDDFVVNKKTREEIDRITEKTELKISEVKKNLRMDDVYLNAINRFEVFCLSNNRDFSYIKYLKKNYEILFLKKNKILKVFFITRKFFAFIYHLFFEKESV